MHLVKLDAIDSTNDYLKALSLLDDTPNYTVVTAENQTQGKGQMGTNWNSEIGKNLVVSILVKNFTTDAARLFELNIVFAVAVIETLQRRNTPQLSIKWPNDILSGKKKIGGILIENSLKSDGQILSVIGLGLNVNQEKFERLPQASSLKLVTGSFFDKDKLLFSIVENLKATIGAWPNSTAKITSIYTENLFKKGVPTAFEDRDGNRFMGIIEGVSALGKLKVLHEDDKIREYEIKSLKMLY